MITAMPRAILNYVYGFGLTAVAVTRDGRIVSVRDPTGCEAAWWVESKHAGKIIRAVKDADVAGAAVTLGIQVTEHGEVVMRARHAVAKIEDGMAWAQRTGVLSAFNSEYRRRRLEAFKAGRGFMSYRDAQARLRKALGKVAAGAGPVAVVRAVFDPR
jgi:hypothetical protein